MQDLIGSNVGRFEIRRLIGSGGMGDVYEAHDPQLKRAVAIKRVPEPAVNTEARERLLNEARTAARLSHEGVAALYDVVEKDDELFLVMEYVEGETLANAGRPLPEREVAALARQCAAALAAAHARGVIHGDIKPANLMVTDDGRVKLLDFGVAGIMRDALADTATATFASPEPGKKGMSLTYAAPEVLRGDGADPRSDLYSLGIVLYECLTGLHPFIAETPVAIAARMLREDPPPVRDANADVSPPLASVVERLLARDPEERLQSADELIRELDTIVADGTTLEPLSPIDVDKEDETREVARPGRPPLAVTVAGLVLVAVLVLGAIWRFGIDRPAGGVDEGPGVMTAALDPTEWVIAVLPAETETSDPDLLAVGDGLAWTTTARLTDLSLSIPLQVVPATSLREKQIRTSDQARRLLGVTLAVMFHLRRQGDEIRVNLELVDVLENRQLDATTVDGTISDSLTLEEQVADETFEMLSLELGPDREPRLPRSSQEPAFNAYLRGMGHLQKHYEPENVVAAIELLQQAIQTDPAFAEAHAGLGRALLQRWEDVNDPRLVEEAEEACRQAVEIDASTPNGHVCLGSLLLETGRPAEAAAEFDLALRLDPTEDVAIAGLASAYEDLGDFELAETTYQQAIGRRPYYWANYNRLGGFYIDQGRYAEAAEAFEEVVRLAPESYVGYSNLGVAQFHAGNAEAAERLFRQALEINPDDFGSVSNLGFIAFLEGRYEAAAERFARTVELTPGDYRLWGNLGDALYWSDQRRRAEDAYRRAVRLVDAELDVNPRDAERRGLLAYYLAMLGRREEALEQIDRALASPSSNVVTEVFAAQVHYRLGDEETALDHLEAAVDSGYPVDQLRADPLFASLADDPRWEALVGR